MSDPSEHSRRRWEAPVPPVLYAGHVLHQLDQRFRLDFRRAILAGGLAIVALVVGVDLGGVKRRGEVRWLIIGLTIAFVVLGALAIRSTARQLDRLAAHKAGVPTASALRTICLMVGAVFIGLGVVQLLAVNLHEILLGGAITGVVVGIAAQQPLGNFFAGLVMLFARPYVPGARVRVHSGAMGGPFDGRIVYAGLMYTVIETDDGRVNLPNLGLMTSAIGPAVDDDPDSEADAAAEIDRTGDAEVDDPADNEVRRNGDAELDRSDEVDRSGEVEVDRANRANQGDGDGSSASGPLGPLGPPLNQPPPTT